MSLLFKYNYKTIDRYLLNSKYSFKNFQNGDLIVSSVGYKLEKKKNIYEYLSSVEDMYFNASLKGSKFIAFPEMFFISPLTCVFKGVFKEKDIKESMWDTNLIIKDVESLRLYPKNNSLIKLIKPLIKSLNDFTSYMFKKFSNKYHMITASGSSLIYLEGKLYNAQTLYNEYGEIIGRQAKINPMEGELNIGVNYAENIEVFDSSIGKIGIPVCMDASYYENFKILKDKGAEIVSLGTFNLEDYNFYMAYRGILARSKDFDMLFIKSRMSGYVLGNVATGIPLIINNKEMLVKGDDPIENNLITTKIDRNKKTPNKYTDDHPDYLDTLLKEIYR